ncbi:hypothetical protein AK812_SmicGene16294 [Symbiodinium microadriaticum]|uniref:Uncharacterized protein n=1 Tax=Symbiodinium microadriaticum TaxID=2951 RepID=A0A1Q9E0R0_SYMMI|nr:hypothetical protein AK812_SmicGene16294 [Symbiodinium microadriaticum]
MLRLLLLRPTAKTVHLRQRRPRDLYTVQGNQNKDSIKGSGDQEFFVDNGLLAVGYLATQADVMARAVLFTSGTSCSQVLQADLHARGLDIDVEHRALIASFLHVSGLVTWATAFEQLIVKWGICRPGFAAKAAAALHGLVPSG